jgi:hypothetical protein
MQEQKQVSSATLTVADDECAIGWAAGTHGQSKARVAKSPLPARQQA